jgi:hypothetical protein
MVRRIPMRELPEDPVQSERIKVFPPLSDLCMNKPVKRPSRPQLNREGLFCILFLPAAALSADG